MGLYCSQRGYIWPEAKPGSRLTKNECESPGTVPDEYDQDVWAVYLGLHLRLDEAYRDENEQDAFEDEPWYPEGSQGAQGGR
jgi:hypothetical protein